MSQVAKTDLLDNKEVNEAAYTFERSLKIFKYRVANLPAKSVRRVFSAIGEFPLADKDPVFRNKFEHELFVLTLQMIAAKNVMMNAVTANQIEKEKEKTNGESVEESRNDAQERQG